MSTEALPYTSTTALATRPRCDFCPALASVDGKTHGGPWAYMCEPHFEVQGVGLGLGKGQRIIIEEPLT